MVLNEASARRFWSRVDRRGDDECWPWNGRIDANGYGKFGTDWAHRLSLGIATGSVRVGFVVDHLCRNPRCVNPKHLEWVTQAENMRRGCQAQITHCIHGHEFTPENTYAMRYGNGKRRCKRCNADRELARRNRARLEAAR